VNRHSGAVAIGSRDGIRTVTEARTTLLDLFAAGVAAVEPSRVVTEALAQDPGSAPAAILAVGKAAAAMARGAARVYGHRPGLVVSHEPGPVPPGMTHLVAGHPIPDERSLAAGTAALELAGALDIDERLLVLISGGTSALLEAPVPGVTIEEMAYLTGQLLRSGATIDEINVVRSAMSRVKAGGLSRATRAQVTTLAISDVVGDDPHIIGSGPTTPATGKAKAQVVVKRYAAQLVLSPKLEAALDSPHPTGNHSRRDEFRVIASGATAADAAVKAAADHGIEARVAEQPLTGDAEAAAHRVVAAGASRPPGIDVYFGETTLEVSGDGSGGRCQHAALVAAADIADREDLLFLAAGTDGRDGPTEAAGACVDHGSAARARAAGHTFEWHRAAFDSYPWLRASGDLIETGATGTNVGDLWMCWHQS
jgi:hydroxypyruvate reductase